MCMAPWEMVVSCLKPCVHPAVSGYGLAHEFFLLHLIHGAQTAEPLQEHRCCESQTAPLTEPQASLESQAHTPPKHSVPVGQTLLQVPQLALSRLRSTQCLEHASGGILQLAPPLAVEKLPAAPPVPAD